MATAAQVSEFREANRSLVLLAQRDFRQFWEALRFDDPTRVRDALLAFFPDLLETYGSVAAVLGADWYDMLRDVPASASKFKATIASAAPAAQADATVRWGVGPLFKDVPDLESALTGMLGATQRLVLQPGRESTFDAVRSDPVSRSYARVPSGPTTCRWCVMLASRGFAYSSALEAGQGIHFHDRCDCVIVPGRNRDDLPDDYDLDYFRDLYVAGSGVGRDEPTQ